MRASKTHIAESLGSYKPIFHLSIQQRKIEDAAVLGCSDSRSLDT
jgi:hypothetical protein